MTSLEIWCLNLRNSFFYKKISVLSFTFIFVVLSCDFWFQNLPFSGYGIIFLTLLTSLCVSFCVSRGFIYLQNADKLGEQSWLATKIKCWLNAFVDDLFSNEIPELCYRTSLNEQIRLFIKEIERDYVKPWYAEVSTNPSFLFDCHLVLDEVIFKFFNKLRRCHVKFMLRHLLYLYLGHIQELKRSIRRANATGNSQNASNFYRSCHPGSASDQTLNNYLTNIMEIILKENAPHDLVTSLQSSIVIRILARKVLKTIIVNVEDPCWIYSRLLYTVDNIAYQSVMQGGFYSIEEVTEKEPELKRKFQIKPSILSRSANLENNIFHSHMTLGSKAFQSSTNRSNDKNLLSLPLASTKAEPNISSVLGNLISSTAAPLLPENASLCYQPLNKMWLSPVTDVKQEMTDHAANPLLKSFSDIFKIDQLNEGKDTRPNVESSKSVASLGNINPPLKNKDISVGEDLAEGLSVGVESWKKLVKTDSFDEGTEDPPIEDTQEKRDGSASPVYEEPEDFATTIAKLRSVLQQRESTSTASECSNKSMESQDTFTRDNTLDRGEDMACDGPQTASEVPSDGRPIADVYITGTELKDSSGTAYVLYTIEYNGIYIKNNENGENQLVLQPTIIKRRFQEFLNLQARLEENPALRPYLKGIKGPTKWLTLPFNTKTDEATTATRKPVLERYLRELCDRVELAVCPDVHEFLAYGSTAVTTFHSTDNNSSIQKIDKYLSNKVTGVFNSIKTVLPSFDGNSAVADAKEVKELKMAPEQNLLQGFLNFGNKSEEVPPIALNYLVSEPTGDAITDSIRRYLSHKSDCIEDALDVLDSSDWHYEQGECHAVSGTGECVWNSYHQVVALGKMLSALDDLGTSNETPLVIILIDIMCELLESTDCWVSKQPVVKNIQNWAPFLESDFEARLCNLDWDRICGNILRLLRNAVFSQQSGERAQLDVEHLQSTLAAAISGFIPGLMRSLLGADCIETAVRQFLETFKYQKCNRDVLLRLLDILLSELLSCPHLVPSSA